MSSSGSTAFMHKHGSDAENPSFREPQSSPAYCATSSGLVLQISHPLPHHAAAASAAALTQSETGGPAGPCQGLRRGPFCAASRAASRLRTMSPCQRDSLLLRAVGDEEQRIQPLPREKTCFRYVEHGACGSPRISHALMLQKKFVYSQRIDRRWMPKSRWCDGEHSRAQSPWKRNAAVPAHFLPTLSSSADGTLKPFT